MIYVLVYLASIVAANLTIQVLGPEASIVTAFVLIGLDLSLRDKLHEAWRNRGLLWKMTALILAGSAVTYLLNADASRIAVASAAAFGAATVGDTLTYSRLFDRPWLVKANGSNVVGALLDSVLFPTIAFGAVLPLIIAGQFAAKTLGGALWAWIIDRMRGRGESARALG